MEDKTIEGIAQTIHDRGEGDYDAVLAWIDRPEVDLYTLIDGLDEDIIDWYFTNLDTPEVQDYPHYDSEIAPAVNRISDAFAKA